MESEFHQPASSRCQWPDAFEKDVFNRHFLIGGDLTPLDQGETKYTTHAGLPIKSNNGFLRYGRRGDAPFNTRAAAPELNSTEFHMECVSLTFSLAPGHLQHSALNF